jgi:hypothetical protein
MDPRQISDLEKPLAFAFGNIESCLRLTERETFATLLDRYDGTGRKITEIIFLYHCPGIGRKGGPLWSKWESFLTAEEYIMQQEDVKGDHDSVCDRLVL